MERGGAWREIRASGRLGSFVILCLGVWLHAADSFLAATAIPPAIAEIGGLAWINWTLALYQLAGIVSGAATAVAARRHGMRGVLVGAAICYAAGCAASGLAPDMAVMLAGRLIQGIGGGMMIALTYVATQAMFPERLWTRLMAIVSAIWGASSLAGPLIGGLFAQAGLWRAAFYVFGLQAALLALAAHRSLRNLPVTGDRRDTGAWPWPPLLLLSAGTLLIAAAGVVGGLVMAVALAIAGGSLLLGAVQADGRGSPRLMPSALARPGSPIGAGLLMVLALATGATAFASYGPLLTERLFGIGPLAAGGLLASESVAWTCATLLVAGLDPRFERRLIQGGAALITVGGAGLALFMPAGPLIGVLACLMLQGVGFGMTWPFVVKRVVSLAAPGERDLTASATSTMQRTGYALGASATGIVANAAGLGSAHADQSAVAAYVFAASVPVLVAGCVAARRLTARPALSAARARPPVIE